MKPHLVSDQPEVEVRLTASLISKKYLAGNDIHTCETPPGGHIGPLEGDEATCHQMLSTRLENARRTQPVLNSSRPSRARWLSVPCWTSSLA